jgi:hypothetical protein
MTERWNFICLSNTILKKVHIDPHILVYLLCLKTELVYLSFGCMKQIRMTLQSPIWIN